MKTIKVKELKKVGIFDLGKYDKFLLGVNFIADKTEPCFLRPAMWDCQWFYMNTEVGYNMGYGYEVENIDIDNASSLNAYFLYNQEVKEWQDTMVYIAEKGKLKGEWYKVV